MKKIISLIFSLFIVINLSACNINSGGGENQDPIYKDLPISEYGFVVGDYVYEEEVYLAPWYSRLLWKASDSNDGYIYHLGIDEDKTYEKIEINLSDYFSDESSFLYNNKFQYQDIEDIIFVKNKWRSNFQDNHIIMVDKDKNVYLAFGSFYPKTNKYTFYSIMKLSYIGTNQNLIEIVKSKDLPVIGSEILKYLDEFKTFDKKQGNFIKSSFHQNLADKIVFNKSGIFYELYKVSDNIVLEISWMKELVFTLYGIDTKTTIDGIKYSQVIETTTDPNKFEKLLYTYSPELFTSFETQDILKTDDISKDVVYTMESLNTTSAGQLTYVTTLLSSYIGLETLTESDVQQAVEILKKLEFVRITDFERLTLPNRHEYVFSLSFDDMEIDLLSKTDNIIVINGVTYRVISGFDEFHIFCIEQIEYGIKWF